MVKHIVLWDLIDNTQDNFDLVKSSLMSLDGVIKELKSIDVVHPTIDSNCDIALLTSFECEGDLHSYQVNKDHQEVVAKIKPLLTNRRCLDYEF